MSEEDKDSKTEEPSERKKQKAREEGQVVQSQEIKSLAMLLATLVIVAMLAPPLVRDVTQLLTGILGQIHAISVYTDDIPKLFAAVLWKVGVMLIVPFAVMFFAALLVGFSQVGLNVTSKKIQPKLSNLSPMKGIKKVASITQVIELLKGLLKLGIVSSVVVMAVVPALSHPDVYIGQDFRISLQDLHRLLVMSIAGVLIGFVIVAAGDWLWQRRKHMQQLKMTKQEVKDEYKQTEGDPLIKGKLRQLRMQKSRERMMAAVPDASVVITNPTHYAVALKYDMDAMAAPKLVAKGADHIAKRIRELAEENDVPILENPPLARALFASVELDQDIPPEHYKAVAEVIGYVMRLKKMGKAAAGPAPGTMRRGEGADWGLETGGGR